MTIEERVAALELEIAHQREIQRLREVNDSLTSTRVGMVEGQLAQAEKVLPKLRNAMKELEEASLVTGELQTRQGGVLKGHGEWLEELTASQLKTEERWRETDERWRETDKRWRETDERFRETGERIDKLVSAIGEPIRRNGNTEEGT
ncbi:MAG TPA: hypothetical protein VMQ56_06685 [Terracidiphilus sp.]|jgi:uncharacterized coiled-coil protein SlyX|nr:hypothetical protein [Terracidiphilus sp.]